MSKGFLYDEGDELITRKEDAGGLPDTSEASAGDVLSLDSDKEPVWSAPSGGLFKISFPLTPPVEEPDYFAIESNNYYTEIPSGSLFYAEVSLVGSADNTVLLYPLALCKDIGQTETIFAQVLLKTNDSELFCPLSYDNTTKKITLRIPKGTD